jgi:hypothetical protein
MVPVSDSDMALATSSAESDDNSDVDLPKPGSVEEEHVAPPGTEEAAPVLEADLHERVSDEELPIEAEPELGPEPEPELEPGVPGDDTEASSMEVDEDSVPSPPGEGTARLVG